MDQYMRVHSNSHRFWKIPLYMHILMTKFELFLWERLQNMNKKSISMKSQTDWDRINTMEDKDIDLSDIPEITQEQMSRAVLRYKGKHIPKGLWFISVYSWGSEQVQVGYSSHRCNWYAQDVWRESRPRFDYNPQWPKVFTGIRSQSIKVHCNLDEKSISICLHIK